MKRVPEPELMTGEEQARAYAGADFSEPHDMFIRELQLRIPVHACQGTVLDLGCGPGDVTIRFAKKFPDCRIDAVDGSAAMLKHASDAVERENLGTSITLVEQRLPDLDLPNKTYDLIISNSLLHHLHQPEVLWECIAAHSAPDTWLFIMDLLRPQSLNFAEALVHQYARAEPEILQQDFYNSLQAAFTPAEVNQQLHHCGLGHLTIEILSDRHLCIFGQTNPHLFSA